MKNLLATVLFALLSIFCTAQETQEWPITVTRADGLPGDKIVLNYVYKSKVYNLEEAVSTLRFTVISTNTIDTLTNSSDGYSVGFGPGFPLFSFSEFRIYDGEGKEISYTANSNAVATNDGGGLEALNDKNESTFMHSTWSAGALPQAYQYIEFELEKSISSFQFSYNSRSNYNKNLVTHMGITPGEDYYPYPEQQFQLGEQVTSLESLEEEGALFVLRSSGDDEYNYTYSTTINRIYNGKTFFHSTYGGDVTANAASLIYLIPDENVENGYKICFLNNGHYPIKAELNKSWYQWTNDELNAATIQFSECDSVEGEFALTLNNSEYIIAYDPIGKMSLVKNNKESIDRLARPCTFNWALFKASINGSAIASQLNTSIDEAQKRLDAIGKIEAEDNGEYDSLIDAIAEAKALILDENTTAAAVIAMKSKLNKLTGAYAATTIWAYVDSIQYIIDAIENEEILTSQAPEWVEGSYDYDAGENLRSVSDKAVSMVDNYQSLADVDAAIETIYEAIDKFWASKINNVKDLPFRVGTTEDGLPGTLESYGGYRWESPTYFITEETSSLRFTIFDNNNKVRYKGTDFAYFSLGEIEFYDGNGNKISLSAEDFESNSVMIPDERPDGSDYKGFAAVVDGDPTTHLHSTWSSGYKPVYDEDPNYHHFIVNFPEPISSFKYVQYGRKTGVGTPTDFVIGLGDKSYTPADVELKDFYNTTLGEQITDVSQLTDEGLYALVGLLNCAPEGTGEGNEKYYSSNKATSVTKIAAQNVFSIRKTGDEDGTFYIQSLSDGKYWSGKIDDDGWGEAAITFDKAEAARFNIVSNASIRAEASKSEFENTFVIYQYNDTVVREDSETQELKPHPYIVVQDWGDKIGNFSIKSLVNNDFDGEGEWRICKVSMDRPHCYWLKTILSTAENMNIEVSPDPGYYSEETAGAFASAIAKAQQALEANDDANAKAAIAQLEATITTASQAVLNPMVEGIYVIESAYADFFKKQGVKKAICGYYNDFEANSPHCTSEYSLWWTDGPACIADAHDRYKFEFIPTTNNEMVKSWVENELISASEAENAYFIRNLEINQYVSAEPTDNGEDIGFTEDSIYPYIVRSRGNYKWEIFYPCSERAYKAYGAFHTQGHNSATGVGGDIIYWTGSAEMSQWHLRSVSKRTSISDLIIEGDEAVSVSYYTAAGVKVPKPVKGVNIVNTVYRNGIIETKKLFVK